ncbi:MAG: class I SAM-dependent methyltransferase [Bacteroidaceae bacterium]|nr:class I SAM-dependent methyltransferase [Bacteroidaceae bacterium]
MSMMEQHKDPMGRAIQEYWKTGDKTPVRVFSPMFEEDEMPVETLFRTYDQMPKLEQQALDLSRGKTLDVGAGAGCHSLILQERGIDVTAIDISPLSVETMRGRGVMKVLQQDFFTLTGQYDTLLLLMNGIGIVGKAENLPVLFHLLDRILAPGGQLLFDSSDLCYLFEDEDGIIELPDIDEYYGNLVYQLQYKDTLGEPFNWSYIDADTVSDAAEAHGYQLEILAEGPHYDYLARITKGGNK